MRRAAGVLAGVSLVALLLGGCADGAGDGEGAGVDEKDATARLTAAGESVDEAVEDLVGLIASALATSLESGTVGYADCGMALSGQTKASARLNFASGMQSPDATARAISDALAGQGWTVSKAEGPVVSATGRDLTLGVRVGAAVTVVRVEGACIDAPREVGKEFTSRPNRRLPG